MSQYEQYFVKPENVDNGHFFLVDEENRHAIQVRRSKPGDTIVAVDGDGNRYVGTLEKIEKKRCQITIITSDKGYLEPRLKLVLVQALLKGNHFDLIVEKATELGVSRIIPVQTSRTITLNSGKIERWQNKAITAMKQCARSICPTIDPVQSYRNVVESVSNGFIAHEAVTLGDQKVFEKLKQDSATTLFIGPEGGFSDQEVQLAHENGIIPFRMGSRRLRSETAAIAACVKLFSASGDLE